MKRLLVAVLGLFVAVACSSNNQLGKPLANMKQAAQGGFENTTTTKVPATLPPAQGTSTTAVTRTTVAHRTVTTPPTTSAAAYQAAVVHISINPDSSQAQFTPSAQQVYPGSPVMWTNHDKVTRSVVSDDGSTFNSGPIAPGASFTWTAGNHLGRINYHDGTRPYAVANLDVIKQP